MFNIWWDFAHSNVNYFVYYEFFTVIINEFGSLPDNEFYYENYPDTMLYVSTIFWCKAFLNIIAALEACDAPKLFMSLLYIIGRLLAFINEVSFFDPC
jgi:hypothetical protein